MNIWRSASARFARIGQRAVQTGFPSCAASRSWGTRASVSSYRPAVDLRFTVSIGKSTFIKYYLARELALRRPAVFYIYDELYVFSCRGVHRITEPFEFTNVYWSILGLIDTGAAKPPPPWLAWHSPLFLLQDVSPNPAHIDWIKHRASSVGFVFNPLHRMSCFLRECGPPTMLTMSHFLQSRSP